MKTSISLLIFFLVSCSQSKFKVVVEQYESGTPKTVRYFFNRQDTRKKIHTYSTDGFLRSDMPITFLEEKFYENGVLQYRGLIKKGVTNGLWEYYYETGLPQARSYYLDELNTDSVLCWYESGKMKRQMIEIDTSKNYWHNVDYYENGRKMIECYQYLEQKGNFILNGTFKEWFQNGRQKFEINLKDNRSNGKWKEWDSTGKLIEESDREINVTLAANGT